MTIWAKWLAITAVIEPAILYPLLNTFYSPSDLKPIDFHKLNAQLWGSIGIFHLLSSMVPPYWEVLVSHPFHKNKSKDCISHFIFNLRCTSTVQDKLEVYIIYTQMEVGTFSHYLTCSYDMFGHLLTMLTLPKYGWICNPMVQIFALPRKFHGHLDHLPQMTNHLWS